MKMPRQQPSNGKKLPEAQTSLGHWGAGAAISIWAVAVQRFPSPFNEIGALLSPGIGYAVGVALDAALKRVAESSRRKEGLKELSRINETLANLKKERNSQREAGADQSLMLEIDSLIRQKENKRISMMATMFEK